MTTLTPVSATAPPKEERRRGGRAPNADPAVMRAGLGTALLFVGPYLVLFCTFVLAPIVYGLWISLHTWDFLLPGKPFVGLQNYIDLFTPGSTTSEPFWSSMRATAIFTVLSVPLLMVLPLALAVALNKKFHGRNAMRAIFFAPFVLGVAVIGLLWRYLLDPNVGVVNYYLDQLGIDRIPFTTAMPWVWLALVIPTIWWTAGYNMVIFLAGLQDISAELYEAAELDGAKRMAAVPPRHAAGPAPGERLRSHHHDPRLGQRLRPAVPHHPGPTGSRRRAAPSCRSVRKACAGSTWAAPRR